MDVQGAAALCFQPCAHIFQAVADMLFLLLGGVLWESVAVVLHNNANHIAVPFRNDEHDAILAQGAYSVTDCVFHQRLYGQRRKRKVDNLQVIDHLKAVSGIHLFQFHILLYMFQLPLKGNHAVQRQRVKVFPQVAREIVQSGRGQRGIGIHKFPNRTEAVKKEMRVHLPLEKHSLMIFDFIRPLFQNRLHVPQVKERDNEQGERFRDGKQSGFPRKKTAQAGQPYGNQRDRQRRPTVRGSFRRFPETKATD